MDKHHTAHLTKQGQEIAILTREKHNLLTRLLGSLGVPDDIASDDACAIEHDLSAESFLALKKLVQERSLPDSDTK